MRIRGSLTLEGSLTPPRRRDTLSLLEGGTHSSDISTQGRDISLTLEGSLTPPRGRDTLSLLEGGTHSSDISFRGRDMSLDTLE